MRKVTLSLVTCLFIFIELSVSSVSAQFQPEFGQDLLEKKFENSKTESAKLTLNAHFSNTFNNHIELGLSVDPYTSSLAGEEDPQLAGLINRLGVNLGGDLPIDSDSNYNIHRKLKTILVLKENLTNLTRSVTYS
ncbi:MAG: hypothetical protein OXU23_18400 [Candidatus Poribacteria bacterium]|nr:hypothetical protein [Candidatus Poribacteria bacterium]